MSKNDKISLKDCIIALKNAVQLNSCLGAETAIQDIFTCLKKNEKIQSDNEFLEIIPAIASIILNGSELAKDSAVWVLYFICSSDNTGNQLVFASSGALPHVIGLLESDLHSTRDGVCKLISSLSFKATIVSAGAIPLLVKQLVWIPESCAISAVIALIHIANGSSSNQILILDQPLIPNLFSFLSRDSLVTVREPFILLEHLAAAHEVASHQIMACRGISLLANYLENVSTVCDLITLILGSLVSHAGGVLTGYERKIIPSMLSVLRNDSSIKVTAAALQVLCTCMISERSFMAECVSADLVPPVLQALRTARDPPIKLSCVHFLHLLASSTDGSCRLSASAAIPELLEELCGGAPQCAEEIAALLLKLAAELADASTLVLSDRHIGLLTSLLSGPLVGRAAAVLLVGKICISSVGYRESFGAAGAGPALVSLLANSPADAEEEKKVLVRALGALALDNAENSESIVKVGGVPPLVSLLDALHCIDLRLTAAKALGYLAITDLEVRQRVVDANGGGATSQLVALLREGDETCKDCAVRVLSNLLHNCESAKKQVVAAGAMRPLVVLLLSGSTAGKEGAVSCICSLVMDNDANQQLATSAGSVPALISLLEDSQVSEVAREYGIWAATCIAGGSQAAVAALVAGGATQLFVSLLQVGSEKTRVGAAWGLSHLAKDRPEVQRAAAEAGAVPLLLNLLASCEGDLAHDGVRR